MSSGLGTSAISVVRISGPDSRSALEKITGWSPGGPRVLRWLVDPGTAERIDQALVLWFAAPRSATGEDVAELHVHGSPAVRSRLLKVLGELPGLRLAEPGEFSRRALMNGKLDLAQAESLADLLSAETEAQHRQAVRGTAGIVGTAVERWRERLISALALIETEIDFSEEDLPPQRAAVRVILRELVADLEEELRGSLVAERLRDGFEVAVVGKPNVGKSTLLNAIARREIALTSPEAGTTRDVLEVRVDLAGLPVTFLDTAGFRPDAKGVEAMGIDRARRRAAQADLRVILVDRCADVAEFEDVRCNGDLVVRAKVDAGSAEAGLGVSGLTGNGLSELVREIERRLEVKVARSGVLVGQRQRQVTGACVEACRAAATVASAEGDPEIVAEELRVALVALDRLTGRKQVDEVLDSVFSRFCIGK